MNQNNEYVNKNPFVIANKIIDEFEKFNKKLKSNSNNKNDDEWNSIINDLTQLKLQKILYLTYGYYYSLTRKKLFKAEFEAWQYGPVIKEIYDKRDQENKFSIEYIKKEYKKLNKNLQKLYWNDNSNKFENYFRKIIKYFFMFSAWNLVDETHNSSSWRDAFDSLNKNSKIINIDKIHDEFAKIDDSILGKFRK